jgi:colanic acid biosynthesis glycosyl transferase WcaI
MGPIATLLVRELTARGHSLEVVTSHPHYPGPLWGQRLRPYCERRDGIPVYRLPLWIGHRTAAQRIREEVTYVASTALAAPLFSTPDVFVAVSPAFLALGPIAVSARLRRAPLVIWLQDVFPDAAATTRLLENRVALRTAQALERAAYAAADQIVVISETFKENLVQKGVPEDKVVRIYNPATRGLRPPLDRRTAVEPPRLLSVGNIGYSQGLVELVRAFERSEAAESLRLVLAGTGELADAVRAEIRSEQVEMLGLVDDRRLDDELDRAALALVSQRGDIEEFNLPSKLMTLMGRGLPVLASVGARSEAARIVSASGGGWVTDSARPEEAVRLAAGVVREPEELRARGAAALEFAREHFSPEGMAERFERVLDEVTAGSPGARTCSPHGPRGG